MSATFKDKAGNEYKLHQKFVDGNFTIISYDKVAFKLDDFYLKAHSPVFRSMLVTCDDKQEAVLHLEYYATFIAYFVTALKGLAIATLHCGNEREADAVFTLLKICSTYETPIICRVVLQSIRLDSKTSSKQLFPLFVVASQFNDLNLARRVIERCHYLELHRENGISLHPDSKRTRMKGSDIEKINSRWIWALYEASRLLEDRWDNWDEEYFMLFSGHFVALAEG
ncbi:hypothetical protein BCR39DRAFT_542464 [Naematelia encephala]|uniref:BTB domain-containing protein n=1 Tax=Naematelia encephala TaxID=71784 RepID=A0A1Y2AU45_9TREE|nr:hypothetical protein BCR39DRAFT_542464 [Naematelia encephala]